MSAKLITKEGYTVTLEVTVTPEVFEQGMQKSYIKNVKNMNIHGFRKGKAPRKYIERIYSEAIFYDDAVNYVFPDAYEAAIKELDLEPVDRPNVDVKQIGEGKELVMEVKVDVKPDPELSDYKGIKATKKVYNVTDEEVDAEIEKLRDRNSRMITVEDRAVKEGDTVVIDYEGFVDETAFDGGKAEGQELVIGSGTFIPGFEDQVVGAKTGDDLEINVTFPEEYHAEELKGKPAMFKVKVHQIKYKELPELDDEFAKDVSEFDTLKELKEDIKKKFTEQNEQRSKNELENEVVGAVMESMKVDIPQAMIETRIDGMLRDFEMRLYQQGMSLDMYRKYTGLNEQDFRNQFKAQAENAVKSTLALEKVAQLEHLEATDEDLEKKLEQMAKYYQMELDKVKEILREEDKENLKKDCLLEKAADFLVQNAVVTEEKEKKATKTKKAADEKEKKETKKTASKSTTKTASKTTSKTTKTTAKKETAKKTTKKETKKDSE